MDLIIKSTNTKPGGWQMCQFKSPAKLWQHLLAGKIAYNAYDRQAIKLIDEFPHQLSPNGEWIPTTAPQSYKCWEPK